jgi:catalase
LIVGDDAKVLKAFVAAMAKHRVWDREERAKAVPA